MCLGDAVDEGLPVALLISRSAPPPHQRVIHIDDLIQRWKQQDFQPIILRFAHRFLPMPVTRCYGITNRSKQNPKTQESEVKHPAFLQNPTLFCLFLRPNRFLHGRRSSLAD
jgi:hypothetical protein